VQYLQAFLFFYCCISKHKQAASDFQFFERKNLQCVFHVVLPKNTVPICFLLFFWISFFYFHDVECMCIKRRDTYDQWIVAETCTFLILFLFVKQFATLFSMEEVQLETLISA